MLDLRCKKKKKKSKKRNIKFYEKSKKFFKKSQFLVFKYLITSLLSAIQNHSSPPQFKKKKKNTSLSLSLLFVFQKFNGFFKLAAVHDGAKMARICVRRMGSGDFWQQLHFLELLRRLEISDESNPTSTQ